MPTHTDQAIVIRLWDWSETSQTVSLFCRSLGVIRGVAKGAKREKAKFSGGFDALTRGQVVAIIKSGVDLANVIEWDLQEVFPALRSHLASHYAGMYMADLVHHMITDADPHPTTWDALIAALRALEPGRAPAAALARFQWALLGDAGYSPQLDVKGSASTVGFDPVEGRVTPDPGPSGNGGAWRVRRETIDLLRSLAGRAGAGGAPGDAAWERAARLLASYIRWLLGSEPPSMTMAFPARPKGSNGGS